MGSLSLLQGIFPTQGSNPGLPHYRWILYQQVEKDERGVSTLYSLADFVDEDGSRIRKDESYEKNYLIGKYGAIPTLKSIDIFKEE